MQNQRPDDQGKLYLWLGYAGLLPQLFAVILAWRGGEWGFVALAGGFAYAALIFSFLGGVWWGQTMAHSAAPRWGYLVAILPSLIGLALFLPWTLGWAWPDPALIWLGLLIAASPLIDRSLGLASAAFMRLRWHLSLGLGALTFALGLMAMQQV